MEKKDCFGILEKVFPEGKNGLREVEKECFECPDRVACLRDAITTKEGLKMQEEILDRAAAEGLVGRLQRWSRKKELNRRAKLGREK